MSNLENDEDWVRITEDDTHLGPELLPIAGLQTLPRKAEPSIWHQLAWDEDYEGPIGVLPLPPPNIKGGGEVVEEKKSVAGGAVVNEEEEQDMWKTEMRDAFDNIWGFGLEEDAALETIEDIIASGAVLDNEVNEEVVKVAEEAVAAVLSGVANVVEEEEEEEKTTTTTTKSTTTAKKVEKKQKPVKKAHAAAAASAAEKKVSEKKAAELKAVKAEVTKKHAQKNISKKKAHAEKALVMRANILLNPELMYSREFPDTKMWRTFGKPAFHSYGMRNTEPTFGGVGWGGYMQTFNVGPQTLPNYPNSKQVVRSAEFKYNAAAADPSIPGASILNVRDVVSVPFNPLFNPMIIDDGDIGVASGKTDKVARNTNREKKVVETRPVKKAVIPSKKAVVESKASSSKASKKVYNQPKKPVGATLLSADVLKWPLVSEIKSVSKPPPGIEELFRHAVVLTNPGAKVKTWSDIASNLSRGWVKAVRTLDVSKIKQRTVDKIRKTVSNVNYGPEAMSRKSLGASIISQWLIDVYEEVSGKMLVLKEAPPVAEKKKVEKKASGIQQKGEKKVQKKTKKDYSKASAFAALKANIEENAAEEKERMERVEEKVQDPIELEVITVYRCNPRLMKKLAPVYYTSIPIAGMKIPQGDTAEECIQFGGVEEEEKEEGGDELPVAGVVQVKGDSAADCLKFA
ncbi:hypothetical protein TL16_g05259 [Triparma laevis f. inornata]|uniref:Uncharacterized protein n=2 Tax=Triparma laevis TaxID=1534972 RepID=A0A9W6ZJL3_9STRA|nr:hypothetical protein TrLO_g3577 [Triparma laevis f. longispina]GMH69854.1 hypothetical protein TL16_g05259 [Triparma laevis f. inornata]